ncbi:toll/interleukin-1 receptor domain-containing protein [Streptomyces sp. MN03-5084-2B]|nr:toll/interleukin-1 receptor domain-containing protein [Streptomyces sp. MN03-5084-2B]
MNTLKGKSVFLSHNWADKTFARKLAWDLKTKGCNVWIDEGEMKPGDSLLYKITAGIENIDYIAVVLSPDSVKSRWVEVELEMAMTRQIEEQEVRIVPLLYRECDIPLFLRGKLYLDFRREEKYSRTFDQLYSLLVPERDRLRLTAKEAARWVNKNRHPNGELVSFSQQGTWQQYISSTSMHAGDWVEADAKGGRSRTWVVEYYNKADRIHTAYTVYDGVVSEMPRTTVHGGHRVPITFNFVDSDRAVSEAERAALAQHFVPNEDDYFVNCRLVYTRDSGIAWFVTFLDEALRAPTAFAELNPYTGDLRDIVRPPS